MKKYIFYSLFFLAFAMTGRAQTAAQTNSTVTAAQLKSAAQERLAYNSSTGGSVFTTAIVNRVAVPLSLTATQQKSMNNALYNYFNQKGSLTKLKWSDNAAYQQQANTLLQQFIGQLGAFLSPDQVSKFVAMRPASA